MGKKFDKNLLCEAQDLNAKLQQTEVIFWKTFDECVFNAIFTGQCPSVWIKDKSKHSKEYAVASEALYQCQKDLLKAFPSLPVRVHQTQQWLNRCFFVRNGLQLKRFMYSRKRTHGVMIKRRLKKGVARSGNGV
jgi:hypothetical protein